MKRAALFIGVNRYEDPEINPLEFAEADATELYAFFKHRAGYDDVRHLLSPDSDLLLDTAHGMATGLAPDDLFLIFFAGHGVEHDGKHLLLCPRSKFSRLKYQQHVVPLELLKVETAKEGLHRVLILDACRSHLLKGERDATGSGLRDVSAIRRVAELHSTQEGALAILCSCDEGQQAREISPLRQGLFTHALLNVSRRALQDSVDLILGEEMEHAIARDMQETALQYSFTVNQRPWIQRSGQLPPLIVGTEKGGGVQKASPTSSAIPSIEQVLPEEESLPTPKRTTAPEVSTVLDRPWHVNKEGKVVIRLARPKQTNRIGMIYSSSPREKIK